MTETLALAVGIPLALGAICLVSRRSRQLITADTRGIALQTVIVIVVMLVIAGGVSGVLLSRGSDVISDLESSDVSASEINSLDECTDAFRALTKEAGTAVTSSISGEKKARWTTTQCVVHGTADGSNNFTQRACEQYRGPSGGRATFASDSDGDSGANGFEMCTIA